MYLFLPLATSLGLLSILYCAVPLAAYPTAADHVLQLPIRKNRVEDTQEAMQTRDLSATLKNDVYEYLIDLEFGSTHQRVTLSIDTGSTEIWVFSSSGCDNCLGGTYNPEASKDRKNDKSLGTLNQQYFDQSSVIGDFVKDTVFINGVKVKDVTLGVAKESHGFSGKHGIMGLGPPGLESTSKQYPAIIDVLHKQRVIEDLSYSVHLNKHDTDAGTIIFGGDDHSKYQGDLVFLDIIPFAPADSLVRLQVLFTSLTITDSSGRTGTPNNSALPYPASLDTGSTLTYLPVDMWGQIYFYLGGKQSEVDANGMWIVPCRLPEGHLTFGFGEGPVVTIRVPFSELARPLSSGKCQFGLSYQDRNVLVFGDTFLRSAYVKFDYGKGQIGLAQSIWT